MVDKAIGQKRVVFSINPKRVYPRSTRRLYKLNRIVIDMSIQVRFDLTPRTLRHRLLEASSVDHICPTGNALEI